MASGQWLVASVRKFAICIVQFAFCNLVLAAPMVVPVDSKPFPAELTAMDGKWQISFTADGRPQVLSAADLIRWGQCPERARSLEVVLPDGGLLSPDAVAADKDKLSIDSATFGTMKLPLDSLAGIVFHPPADRQAHDRLLDRLTGAKGQNDRLLLDNGDELIGFFEGIEGDAVRLKTDSGPVDVKLDRAAALIFNPALRRKPTVEANSPRIWAGFADGSRLLATRLTVEGNAVQLTAAGQSFSTKRQDLVFLQPVGGRATYLSDLQPADYRQTPYLDLAWPYQRDRNVTGGRLRSGGQMFLKGLGVHSAARLVYSLEGRAVRFEALAGIDDSTQGAGSVVFRVLVDGQERFTSPVLRGGDAPMPVSVDLSGARTFELLVDYADRADVLDHADWLEARIVGSG